MRLILSALLCIMGLAAMISMIMGLFVDLSVYDKSLVAIAIFMVGIPSYLIISGLATVDEHTIVHFLNDYIEEMDGKSELLILDERTLTDKELEEKKELESYLELHPVHTLLPAKPVKQAYFLMLVSLMISFGIWYIG